MFVLADTASGQDAKPQQPSPQPAISQPSAAPSGAKAGPSSSRGNAATAASGETRRLPEDSATKQTITVNGRTLKRRVEPRLLLTDFIRHDVGLTGTHVGCENGVCGACTVLLDGLATRACCTLAVQADGRRIETVESLGRANNLNPLQRGFWEMHGLQCGYCTPGMLMLMTELLRENPQPDRDAIRQRLNDNICRCTGYEDIVNSVERAVELMRGGKAAR